MSRISRYHPILCRCPKCTEHEKLREQHITRESPTGALPTGAVSLQELIDNATLTLPHKYEIGEDWSDD